MRDTTSITDIQGNAWGTMFLEGETGSVWYVSQEGSITNLLSSGAKSIAVGYNHGVIVTNSGTALTFHTKTGCDFSSDYSNRGQHGVGEYSFGSMEIMSIPVNDVVDAQCGVNWTALLDRDGVMWFAGDNSYGVAGLGKDSMTERRSNLSENFFVPSVDGLRSIHAGPNHCFVVTKDGELLFAGRNVAHAGGFDYSSPWKIGANKFVPTGLSPLEVHTSHRKTLVLDKSGVWWHTGDARTAPGSVPANNPFVPRDKWGAVPELDLRAVVLRGDSDGVGLANDGEILACGSSKNAGKYGKSRGSLHGIVKLGEYGEAVALTEGASLLRKQGEWFSSGPACTAYSLGPTDGRVRHEAGCTGFFKMAHPEVWHLALNLTSMGIPWNEAVDSAAAMS